MLGAGGTVRPAGRTWSPRLAIAVRLGFAALLVLVMVGVVVADRSGYRDTADDMVSVLDAVYYATVTLSTTGYGDITPVTDGARLVNIVVVTPLRVLFLIILVGTTLEVLTERSREQARVRRWRSRLREHTVVLGYGTKGRSAVLTVLAQGTRKDRVVVVDPVAAVIEEANAAGITGIVGDATRGDVLRQAHVDTASAVIVALDRDDSAVLATLTVRQLTSTATVVAAVREGENAPLLRQSGADSVVTSSDAAGRLLGLSTRSRYAVQVIDDLLDIGAGLDILEREVAGHEVGRGPHELDQVVLGVVRAGRILSAASGHGRVLQAGDRVVCVTGEVESQPEPPP